MEPTTLWTPNGNRNRTPIITGSFDHATELQMLSPWIFLSAERKTIRNDNFILNPWCKRLSDTASYHVIPKRIRWNRSLFIIWFVFFFFVRCVCQIVKLSVTLRSDFLSKARYVILASKSWSDYSISSSFRAGSARNSYLKLEAETSEGLITLVPFFFVTLWKKKKMRKVFPAAATVPEYVLSWLKWYY